MMNQYTEQILYTGEARNHSKPMGLSGRLIITVKRFFFIPKRNWLGWGNNETHDWNVEDVEDISFSKKRLRLRSAGISLELSGPDMESVHKLLLAQQRRLATDKIQPVKQVETDCLLLFQMVKTNREDAALILTHRELYLGGRTPLECQQAHLPTVNLENGYMVLIFNNKEVKISGKNIAAAAAIVQTLKTGCFPTHSPIKGQFNTQPAWIIPCRNGIAISAQTLEFVPFSELTELKRQQEDVMVSHLRNDKIVVQRLKMAHAVPIFTHGFLKQERERNKGQWSDFAISQDTDHLRFGTLTYDNEHLSWQPGDKSKGWTFPGLTCSKMSGDDDQLRIQTPDDGVTLEISSGRQGQAELWMMIENQQHERPSSPVAEFIDLRASIRLPVNRTTQFSVLRNKASSQQSHEDIYDCTLIDISFGGCALGLNLDPLSLNCQEEESLFEILIPLQDRKLNVQGIIGNVIKMNHKSYRFRCGIQFVNLTRQMNRDIFNEILDLERKQLIKMESISKTIDREIIDDR